MEKILLSFVSLSILTNTNKKCAKSMGCRPADLQLTWALLSWSGSYLQWNPDNPVNNGPEKSGRINGMAVLKGFFK